MQHFQHLIWKFLGAYRDHRLGNLHPSQWPYHPRDGTHPAGTTQHLKAILDSLLIFIKNSKLLDSIDHLTYAIPFLSSPFLDYPFLSSLFLFSTLKTEDKRCRSCFIQSHFSLLLGAVHAPQNHKNVYTRTSCMNGHENTHTHSCTLTLCYILANLCFHWRPAIKSEWQYWLPSWWAI